MNSPVVITKVNGDAYFALERLTADAPVEAFECRVGEYADYLREDALRAQADHVALTWLLRERESHGVVAFMSLIADVEHDGGVLAFYQKNGFAPNAELTGKLRKTISMRLDLYI